MTEPLSWPRAVALHLAPGVAGFAVFLAAGRLVAPVHAMFAAVLLAIVPIELAILRRYRVTLDLRRPPVGPLLLTLAAAALAPGLVQWLQPPPVWDLTPAADPLTLTGWVVCFVVAGPVVEECYFRGFLLPRLPRWRVPANALLFALYHLWQPHAWLTVAVFAVPLAVVALRPRGVMTAATVHCLVNLATLVALLA